jgi:hypothetical protein
MPRFIWSTIVLVAALSCQVACAIAESGATCASVVWAPPADTGGEGVQAILQAIPVTAKWAELPAAVKIQLQTHADKRLAAFRARWGAESLARKEMILLGCPTPEMTAAIDDYYGKNYDTVLPAGFSLKDIRNTTFSRALVSHYLATIAAYRATLTYPGRKLPNRDWDGTSLFDSIRLPDRQTYEDIKAFSARVVADLRAIDDTLLSDNERALKQVVLFDARGIAAGGFSGDSYGGSDMEVSCEIMTIINDVVQGFHVDGGRPKIFPSDDAVLREINAAYLHSTRLKWVDVGTVASTIHLNLCRGDDVDLERYVGKPASSEIARGMVLLRNWWIERLAGSAEARNKCTTYSARDRARIWESFSADQRSNNDSSSSMSTYRAQLESYRVAKIAKYRDAANLALQQVFPDNTVVTDSQRRQVVAAINAETAFGLLIEKVTAALDAAQGAVNGPAAVVWKNAFATKLERVGGDLPRDEATIRGMFDEVKTWVGARYAGYPIDVASLFSRFQFTVNDTGGAETDTSTGSIKFGIGTQRSKMEYYSLLLHELRHAVAFAWRNTAPDKSKVATDTGTALEGSGVAVEEILLAPFLKEVLKNDLVYALYSLDYGIRDARFVGTTDATLQKYFRDGCSGDNEPNTIDFVKRIATSYGLTGDKANTLALRAHAGTQYFQYISAGVQIVDDIMYLQQQIDPGGKHQIDPFVLFACGLNTPRRDQTYVAALKACMKL